MNFITRKQQPLDTATRMRLIKRNISNALYGNGTLPKGGFRGSENVSISLFQRGLDTYLIPRAPRILCDDPSIVDGSLSFLLDKPENTIFVFCGVFPLSIGNNISGLNIGMPDKQFSYGSSSINDIPSLNTKFSAAGGYWNYYNSGNEGILFIEGQKSKDCLLKAIPELMSPPWTDMGDHS